MAYSEKLIDHYENPRNVGSLDKNSEDVGTGLVGAPACGDVMKLQIKVGPDGLIEDAKFKTFGCGSAIASSLARHRVGQGQDDRRGRDDQEHRDRQAAGAAAGEDPLLGAGRGRDQGGDRRLSRQDGEEGRDQGSRRVGQAKRERNEHDDRDSRSPLRPQRQPPPQSAPSAPAADVGDAGRCRARARR